MKVPAGKGNFIGRKKEIYSKSPCSFIGWVLSRKQNNSFFFLWVSAFFVGHESSPFWSPNSILRFLLINVLWKYDNILYKCILVLSCFSRVQLFATLWTAVHKIPLSMGILQARILEWSAMTSSSGSFWPRDWTCISCRSCIGRLILYCWATWEACIFKWI